VAVASVISAVIAGLSAIAVALIGAGVVWTRRQQSSAIRAQDALNNEMARALVRLERREDECNARLKAAELQIRKLERKLGAV
jgi:uncharacterized protein HemX